VKSEGENKSSPAKPETVSRAKAFRDGLLVALSIPGFILFASAAGFGALARDAGLSLGNAALMMGAFFALPAQVVMTDQIARGGSLAAAALAVALIGVRLLPMTVVLVPHLGLDKAPAWQRIAAAHAIAITAWIEGMRRLPQLPDDQRLAYFGGLGWGLVVAATAGTLIGFIVAGQLPPLWAAALLFLTPIYFMIALLATAVTAGDWGAITAGALLGPPLFLLAPGFDLLLTGLIGGTIAHVYARRQRRSVAVQGTGGGP
jgi:predicted branched-subunit amino acid permease